MSKRKLTQEDAIEIWIRRWLGAEKHAIVREFDQNPIRVYEVWSEEKFKGTREEAMIIFRTNYPHLVDLTDFSPHKKLRRLVSRSGTSQPDERQGRLL